MFDRLLRWLAGPPAPPEPEASPRRGARRLKRAGNDPGTKAGRSAAAPASAKAAQDKPTRRKADSAPPRASQAPSRREKSQPEKPEPTERELARAERERARAEREQAKAAKKQAKAEALAAKEQAKAALEQAKAEEHLRSLERRTETAEARLRDAEQREQALARRCQELSNLADQRAEQLRLAQLAPTHRAAVREPELSEAYFSPGEDCLQAIRRNITHTRRTLDICVFTITDDRVSNSILEAHRRGVAVRIITDNDKAEDQGSDIDRLARAGIEVREDQTEFHMHHKFALFDGQTVLTGSYNWTRGAAANNNENLVVSRDPLLVGPFEREFEKLWLRLARSSG